MALAVLAERSQRMALATLARTKPTAWVGTMTSDSRPNQGAHDHGPRRLARSSAEGGEVLQKPDNSKSYQQSHLLTELSTDRPSWTNILFVVSWSLHRAAAVRKQIDHCGRAQDVDE